MIDKNHKMVDICCQEDSCDAPITCDCQGICTCEEFLYNNQESECGDCCCDEDDESSK